MSKLDLTKPVQTRDGCPVRILCTDRNSEYPIVGLIIGDKEDCIRSWPIDGKFSSKMMQYLDLINVPPKPVKYFVNVYRGGDGVLYAGMLRRDKPYDTVGEHFVKTIEFEAP